MPPFVLDELLKLRQQLDVVIRTCQLQEAPSDVVSVLHAAASLHPNPAPATPLILSIQRHIPQSPRRISQLLQAHGFRRARRSGGNVYWRPNDPAPSAPEPPDPAQHQDPKLPDEQQQPTPQP